MALAESNFNPKGQIAFLYNKLENNTFETRYVDGTPTSEVTSVTIHSTSALPTMATLVNIMVMNGWLTFYRKTPSISRTKFENLNLSCILLQLSSLNPLKLSVKLRMKM